MQFFMRRFMFLISTMKARPDRIRRSAAIMLFCALAFGCQVNTPGEGPNIAAAPDETKITLPDQESLGSGQIRISLLLAHKGEHGLTKQAVEIRNGAALGLKDLGARALTLTIHTTSGGADGLKQLARQEAANGARLIVAVADETAITGLKAKAVPTIAVIPDHAPRDRKVFAFAFDETDSLLYGITHAAGQGAKKAVLFAPEGYRKERLNWLNEQLGTRLALKAYLYRSDESANAILQRAGDALAAADIIAFAGADGQIVKIARAIRSRKQASAKAVFVGHSGWPASIWKNPSLAGAVLARLDTGNLSRITKRYETENGHPPGTEAGYGYDIIAMTAGIARLHGRKGLNRKTLLSKTGFRGTTGVFRFAANGDVERQASIYAVRKRKLVLINPAAKSF